MTPQREAKHLQRAIRNIPVDQIAPLVAADEQQGGMWCIVAGELNFISAGGGETTVDWGDPVEYALYVRYILARPERIHENEKSALAFVRSHLNIQGPTGQ